MTAIEQYLADLDDELRVRLWRRERILTEARGHLEERAAEAKAQERTSQAEAEQRAIAAFGSPGQVAGLFAAEGGGALNRTVVAGGSALSYRVARNRELLTGVAALTVGFFAATVVYGSDFGKLFVGLWGLSVFIALQVLKPAPRPGYVRRWRKLDLATRRQIARALRGGSHVRSVWPPEETEHYRRAFLEPGAASAALGYYRAAFRRPLAARRAARARPIEEPTLILWGVRDRFLGEELIRPGALAPWFAAGNEPTVRRIEEAGHFLQNEAPKRVNEELLRWLGV